MKSIKPNLGILLAILFVFSFALHIDAQTGKTKKETRKEKRERKKLEREDEDDEEVSSLPSTPNNVVPLSNTVNLPDAADAVPPQNAQQKASVPGQVKRYPLRPDVLVLLAGKTGKGSREFVKEMFDTLAISLSDTLILSDASRKDAFLIEDYGITYVDNSKKVVDRTISPAIEGRIHDVRYQGDSLVVEVKFNDKKQPSATAIFVQRKGKDFEGLQTSMFMLSRVTYEKDTTVTGGIIPVVEYGGSDWYVLSPPNPKAIFLVSPFKDEKGKGENSAPAGYSRISKEKKTQSPSQQSDKIPQGYGNLKVSDP